VGDAFRHLEHRLGLAERARTAGKNRGQEQLEKSRQQSRQESLMATAGMHCCENRSDRSLRALHSGNDRDLPGLAALIPSGRGRRATPGSSIAGRRRVSTSPKIKNHRQGIAGGFGGLS
jgi:hypothetical protein